MLLVMSHKYLLEYLASHAHDVWLVHLRVSLLEPVALFSAPRMTVSIRGSEQIFLSSLGKALDDRVDVTVDKMRDFFAHVLLLLLSKSVTQNNL